jgi:hypothetical protein
VTTSVPSGVKSKSVRGGADDGWRVGSPPATGALRYIAGLALRVRRA